MKEQKKEQKHNARRIKGITLIALVVTIVVLLILAAVSITAVFGDNGLLQMAKDAGDKTNEAVGKEQEGMANVSGILGEYTNGNGGGGTTNPTTTPPVSSKPTPAPNATPNPEVEMVTAFGKVDVIWLNTSNGVIPTPNAPILEANGETMTKVKWSENGTDGAKWGADETPSTDSDWYNYSQATGKDDSMGSRWANAKTANGSYFVWIPRFAYRITYYDKDWTTDATAQVTGYYDGLGMWNAEGELKYKLDTGVTTIDYGGEKYIVHPAFETNLDMGGWSEDLAGFWFAKYEMSGSTTALASKPQVASLRSITIGAMYQACRDAKYGYNGVEEIINSGGTAYTHTSYMNSHLVKNSEWGAVALLTQSAYGRNGHEIDINNNSSYTTGNGGGTTSSGGTTNAYNTEKGAHASTTGNIYGIYDMSGGAWEYAASYDKKGNVTSYGSDLVKEAKSKTPKTEGGSEYDYISTKYATAYENGTTDYSSATTVYKVSKTGDAVKEVRTGSTGWFGDYSSVCGSSGPFFIRGGYCDNGTNAGVFGSNGNDGDSYSYVGFRAVLCP